MTAAELARVVLECRTAQREYDRTNSVSASNESMRLERKLDRCVAMVLQGQKELFPGDSPQASGPHDAV